MMNRTTRLLAIVLSSLSIAAVQGATPWVGTLTQQALDRGFLSRLPIDVSKLLGLSKAEQGTEVRQLLAKTGHSVRTFNVGVVNHNEVVVFDVNAQSGATIAYLLTPEGQLSKAVSYQAGGATQPMSAAQAGPGFTREAHFWAARAKAPAPPAQ
jgi:hypothetical protein